MEPMATLAKGANVPIDAPAVRAVLSWTPAPGSPTVDGSALLLRANGRVAGDDDFVFYNQPRHPSGTVRHAGQAAGTDTVEVDLAGLPGAVERVVLTASADGGTFGRVPGLRLVVSDAATSTPLAEFAINADTETAMITGEFYRRDGRWKFRAVGQGYASGLAGLATDFGITVDAPSAPIVTPPDYVPPPPPPGFVPPPFPGPPPPGAAPR
jgi:stress response protein SCP2